MILSPNLHTLEQAAERPQRSLATMPIQFSFGTRYKRLIRFSLALLCLAVPTVLQAADNGAPVLPNPTSGYRVVLSNKSYSNRYKPTGPE